MSEPKAIFTDNWHWLQIYFPRLTMMITSWEIGPCWNRKKQSIHLQYLKPPRAERRLPVKKINTNIVEDGVGKTLNCWLADGLRKTLNCWFASERLLMLQWIFPLTCCHPCNTYCMCCGKKVGDNAHTPLGGRCFCAEQALIARSRKTILGSQYWSVAGGTSSQSCDHCDSQSQWSQFCWSFPSLPGVQNLLKGYQGGQEGG